MLLYHHHTATDVIDLDDETGLWRPIDKKDRRQTSALSIAYRHDYPICGSYVIENGIRYCLYWNAEKTLIFRLPDGTCHIDYLSTWKLKSTAA